MYLHSIKNVAGTDNAVRIHMYVYNLNDSAPVTETSRYQSSELKHHILMQKKKNKEVEMTHSQREYECQTKTTITR